MKDTLAVALVQSPWKLKGDCKLRSLSGEWDHIYALEGQEVDLSRVDQRLKKRVEHVYFVEPHTLIKFAGIDTPEAARALAGMEILLPRAKAAKLEADEYFIADLIDCFVYYGDEKKGRVKSVWESGASMMLELALEDGSSAHVPFLNQFIDSVDPEALRITLKVEWILE